MSIVFEQLVEHSTADDKKKGVAQNNKTNNNGASHLVTSDLPSDWSN